MLKEPRNQSVYNTFNASFEIEGAAFLFGWWNFQLNEMCIKRSAKAIIIKLHNIFHNVNTGMFVY